ncbi:Xenotropic and polytropic retrovirus receptor 1 [Elasticomyces elasticus]|nr:Xenotropic and polytropic retrovirus receptor 1 [Elasticomyces elasticus]KAK3666440.1 Xenotropic and polytropic retrovirus receptor 1 [Elasticomyces elasticus]KAK4931260.1 Xenotropic and polytropic retrovirus receptor 1 [Elasticomyces elasticus]KAK5767809.1 Xenotropic and polytropic retrovirus receptor 1 [Elasticomyces elasticus]
MKFAKELDDNAVAEWKGQYLDYKKGKKKLKAVARALRSVDRPENVEKPDRRSPFASLRDAPVYSLFQQERQNGGPNQPTGSQDSNAPLWTRRSLSETAHSPRVPQLDGDATPRPRPINERSPLRSSRPEGPTLTRYGSIIGTPPEENTPAMAALRQAPSLELPDPAIATADDDEDSDYDRPVSPRHEAALESAKQAPLPPSTQLAHTGDAYQIAKPTDHPPSTASAISANKKYNFLTHPIKRAMSTPDGNTRRPFTMRRMFSIAPQSSPTKPMDVALEAYREVDFRQAEFFLFLDKELLKIEKFYKKVEDEADDRLKVLREQLHVMRDRRLVEVIAVEQKRKAVKQQTHNGASQPQEQQPHIGWAGHLQVPSISNGEPSADDAQRSRFKSLAAVRASMESTKDATKEAIDKIKPGRVGKTSKAMEALSTPERALGLTPTTSRVLRDPQEDYSRRPPNPAEVQNSGPPYRAAKRKLKAALAEYYRGLELLKSYALLNRTAFRKINKKYDKIVNTHPTGRYMSEKIQRAHFVMSGRVDELVTQTEDLYARYFERGNHKVAVSKLRAKVPRPGDYTSPVFRTGMLFAAGTVFGIQGVVMAALRLEQRGGSPLEMVHTQTSYLLQIYAGYFLMLALLGLFVVDAAIFSAFKVNYVFIFEFDTRHVLDWKQLAEMPSYFWFLLGFTMWCNFGSFGTASGMYIYWPVILVGISLLLLCCPPPLFYPRSRGWFLFSNWRLLLAGVFPVEFRDFFLGDMYCSQTYALGNIELFFCLYAKHWNNAPQCNSSHSHLLGFMQTLPGIVRLLQCVRRYYDTRLWTHGVNGGKYTCTIMQYVALSVWRIYGGDHLMAFFIAAASVNSIYCIFWDLEYDWSMPLNPRAKPYPLLRSTLAYRKRIWWYYAAIIIDPILRCNWIFYIIFRGDIQHSSIVSFLIAFSEVIRRGIWVLFRVENEHCANVGRSRAMRDPELPYELDNQPIVPSVANYAAGIAQQSDGTAEDPLVLSAQHSRASGRDVEQGTPATASLRRRQGGIAEPEVAQDSPVYRALQRVGTTFLTAHAQDYERKRKGSDGGSKKDVEGDEDGEDEDSDSDS